MILWWICLGDYQSLLINEFYKAMGCFRETQKSCLCLIEVEVQSGLYSGAVSK